MKPYSPHSSQKNLVVAYGPFHSDRSFRSNDKRPRLAESLRTEFGSASGTVPFRPFFVQMVNASGFSLTVALLTSGKGTQENNRQGGGTARVNFLAQDTRVQHHSLKAQPSCLSSIHTKTSDILVLDSFVNNHLA